MMMMIMMMMKMVIVLPQSPVWSSLGLKWPQVEHFLKIIIELTVMVLKLCSRAQLSSTPVNV